MSSKINVQGIITGHIDTLKDGATGKSSLIDLVVFFTIPLIIAVAFSFFEVNLSQGVASLLVNFGAIFTALLLSVLVLVYDQANKLRESKGEDVISKLRSSLLGELYYNISYAVLVSIFLVMVCLLHSIVHGAVSEFVVPFFQINFSLDYGVYFFTPLSAFLTVNVVLTIVMIVKRMHTLLTTE